MVLVTVRERSALYAAILLGLPFLFFVRGTLGEVLLGDGDAYVQFLPYWTWSAGEWALGRLPLWSDAIFAGFPVFAEPQAAVFHPLQLLFLLLPPVPALNLLVLLYYGAAGVFTLLLAREEGLSPEAGLVGGIAFSYCGFLIGHQAITPISMAAASLPIGLYAVRVALRRPTYGVVLGCAVAVLFVILAGHPQFFYDLLAALLYAIFLGLRRARSQSERWMYTRCVASMLALGVGLAAFQLWPTAELARHSVRAALTYQEFVGPSLPPSSLALSLVSTRLYHLRPNEAHEGMVDVGVVVLVLEEVGALARPRRAAFWSLLAIAGALLWLGDYTPLYRLMFHVPAYNLFRIATRNGIFLDFALALLAAHGVEAVVRRGRDGRPSAARLLAAIAGVVLVYFFAVRAPESEIHTGLWTAAQESSGVISGERMVQELAGPLSSPLILYVVGWGLLVLLCGRWLRGRAAALVLAVLVASHFWEYQDWVFVAPRQEVEESLAEGAAWLGDAERERAQVAMAAQGTWIHFLLEDRESWRRKWTAAAGVNLNMLSKVKSSAGYCPLMLRDYSRLAGDMEWSGEIRDPAFFASPAVDLLNVGWVVAPSPPLGFAEETFASLVPVSSGPQGLRAYRNPGALGWAWGVTELREVEEEGLWQLLRSGPLDPSRVALVAPGRLDRELLGARYARPEALEVRFPAPGQVEITISNRAPAFVVVSQTHYPGWVARVDGRRAPLYQVNGILQGVVVPAGAKRVTLDFHPVSLAGGLALALASLAAFALAARFDWLSLRAGTPAGLSASATRD